MDDKENKEIKSEKKSEDNVSDNTWVDDMKQELEDYIEEQGVYIRQ